jgi:hypothetical protein
VMLVRPGGSVGGVSVAGIGLALLAAVCWAGYILVNRVVGARLPGVQGPAAAACVSACLYIPFGLWVLLHVSVTLVAVGRAAAAGVLCSAIPMAADLRALRLVQARFFGVFMSVNPVFAALSGLIVLGQRLSLANWLSIAAIVTANAIGVRGSGGPGVQAAADDSLRDDVSVPEMEVIADVEGAGHVVASDPEGDQDTVAARPDRRLVVAADQHGEQLLSHGAQHQAAR